MVCNIAFLFFQFLIEVKNSHKSCVPSDWVMVSRYVKYLCSLLCFSVEEKTRYFGIIINYIHILIVPCLKVCWGFFQLKTQSNLLLKIKKSSKQN